MTARVGHWTLDPCEVYIGRGSRWGNPFTYPGGAARSQHPVVEVDDPLAAFEAHVRARPELVAALGELRGKVLGCYCVRLDESAQGDLFGARPRERCHGHVLARLVEELAGG